MIESLNEAQWKLYEEQGYLRLGKIVSDEELSILDQRINDIMLGKADIDYGLLNMQREAGEGLPQSAKTLGSKGSTLNYRKIDRLENDPIFLEYLKKPLFRHICEKVYGKEMAIACYRAMFMIKPAHNGSLLPFHQDRWITLDRDPRVTIWMSLDPSTRANGCLQIFPATHHHLINPSQRAGFMTEEQTAHLTNHLSPVYLETGPGEAVLLHNWTVHGSDGNPTEQARRAFSVCYLDAATQSNEDEKFMTIFE